MKFVLFVLFIFALFLGMGCVGPDDTKPGQAYATQIVWQQQYLMIGREAPMVVWMEGSSLNCYANRGWTTYAIPNPDGGVGGECVAGLNFVGPPDTAFVAWIAGTKYISQTAFAHELCHAWSYQTTGDADNDHLGPCFQPEGANYVTIANDALAREDL